MIEIVAVGAMVAVAVGVVLGWWGRGLAEEGKASRYPPLGLRIRADSRVPRDEIWVQQLDERTLQKFKLQDTGVREIYAQ